MGVNEEAVETGDVGGAGDLGDNGRIRAKFHFLHHFAGKGCAQNAFHDERFAQSQFSAGVMQGGAGADAGSGGTAVHLAVGEDTDVAAVMGGIMSRADEDNPVKEAQVRGEGMADGQAVHDGLFDACTGVNQLAEIGRGQPHVGVFCLDEGVKCAAEGDVVTDAAQAGRVYFLIQGVDEGGDVVEGDGEGTAVFSLGGGGNAAGGGVNFDDGGRAGLVNQTGV